MKVILKLLIILWIGLLNVECRHLNTSIKQDLGKDEQALIAFEFSQDPNVTMWAIFVKEFKKDFTVWKQNPKRGLMVFLSSLNFNRNCLFKF